MVDLSLVDASSAVASRSCFSKATADERSTTETTNEATSDNEASYTAALNLVHLTINGIAQGLRNTG